MRESLAIRVLSTADPAGEDRPSASLLIENHIPIINLPSFQSKNASGASWSHFETGFKAS